MENQGRDTTSGYDKQQGSGNYAQSSKKISVVIPVYNEADNLQPNLETICSHVRKLGIDYEVILIDDGSKDKSWSILEKISKKIEKLRCYGFSRNFGKEAAIRAGLEKACGDAVIIMDSDLEHPPELMARMVDMWINHGYEVVNCRKKDRGKESLLSRVCAKIFYTVFSKLTERDFEGSTDFKLLSRQVYQKYLQLPEYHVFFRGVIPWLGFNSADIEFDMSAKRKGKSRWSFRRLFGLSIRAITSFSSLPLHIVTLLGIIYFIFAVILGLQTLYNYFSGKAVSGFATVILLLLFIGSALMFCLGIIGAYIAKIYDEVKKRPKYIIDKQTGPP